jgi:sugar lactone lactonase YvrE
MARLHRPRVIQAERIADRRCFLGEGPLWDDRSGRLYWLDIEAGPIHGIDPAGGQARTWSLGTAVGSIGLRSPIGFVAAVRDRFVMLDDGLSPTGRSYPIPHEFANMRMNDGKSDPCGGFWAGSMAWEGAPGRGALYRLGPDAHVTPVLRGSTISNGLDWDLSRGRMYFVDSAEPSIRVYVVSDSEGALEEAPALAPIPPRLGVPDGLTLDREGCVWVALWGSGRVHRYRPDGEIDTIVEVPTPHATSCIFGGEDMGTLFITTARKGLARPDPEAGHLFAAHPGVVGRVAFRCQIRGA